MTTSTATIVAVAASIPLVFNPISGSSAQIVDKPSINHVNDVIWHGHSQVQEITQRPGQAYFWTRSWQAGEREAERDLAEGNYRDFEDAESAISWIFDSGV